MLRSVRFSCNDTHHVLAIWTNDMTWCDVTWLSHYVTWRDVISYHIYHIISYIIYFISFHIISYHLISYIISCDTLSYHIILYHIILCHISSTIILWMQQYFAGSERPFQMTSYMLWTQDGFWIFWIINFNRFLVRVLLEAYNSTLLGILLVFILSDIN